MRVWLVLLCLVLMFDAGAAERVALVIGNAAYRNVPSLRNPGRDAQLIATALTEIGFETEIRLDLDKAGMEQALYEFIDHAQGAGIALIYYAGHGMEFGGRNYLIPVDARLRTDIELGFQTVPLDLVMTAVSGARKLQLVVLDACRDNPFASRMSATRGVRPGSRGLARIDSADTGTNTLIAYAAKDGTVAQDGDGEHSPYAEALARALREPGVDVRMLFGRVRDAVLTTTAQIKPFPQRPETYGSIGGEDIYLYPPRPQPASTPPAPPSPGPTPNVDSGAMAELAYWNSIKDSRDAAELESYLARFPQGLFTDLARNRLRTVQRDLLARFDGRWAENSKCTEPVATIETDEDSVSVLWPNAAPIRGRVKSLTGQEFVAEVTEPAAYRDRKYRFVLDRRGLNLVPMGEGRVAKLVRCR